jgi:hypothetical protein
MSLGGAFDGFARIAGIMAVFAIVGPLAFAVQIVLVMAGFNAPLIELLKMLLKLDMVNALLSVAFWVLAIGSMLAAIPPSIIAGFIFALAAVGTGLKAVWMAWLAVAVAIAVIFTLGHVVVPSQSTAVILPSAQNAGQGVALFLMLNILAILPTALCWWLVRSLLLPMKVVA